MLNETADFNSKGVGSLSNRDNADVKQLKWEMSRTSKQDKRPHMRKGGFKKKGASSNRSGGAKQKFNKKANLSKPKKQKFQQKNRKKSKS